MRKIKELENELKRYFDDVEIAYLREDGQITDTSLTLRRNNTVYTVDFADDIFRFSPSAIVNHLERSISRNTLRYREISLEERFITDSLLKFECDCCYIRLLDGVLVADGLEVDLNNLVCFSLENNIITITDKDEDIFEIDLMADEFTWLNDNVEDEEISAIYCCIQKYLQ